MPRTRIAEAAALVLLLIVAVGYVVWLVALGGP
jgi:preprotein translocase subunit Sss1